MWGVGCGVWDDKIPADRGCDPFWDLGSHVFVFVSNITNDEMMTMRTPQIADVVVIRH